MVHHGVILLFLLIAFSQLLAQANPQVQQAANTQEDSQSSRQARKRKVDELLTPKEKLPFEGRTIASLNLRGNTAFSTQALKDFLKYAKEGDAYHAESLQVALDLLRVQLYADNGYLQTRFGEPAITEAPEGLYITIQINEGLCYRAGEIKIVDGTLLTPEQTLAMIGIKSGDIVKGYTVLSKGFERLTRWYEERGYIQYFPSFLPEFREVAIENGQKEGIVDLRISHDEGEQYYISKIKFSGVDEATEAYLRAQLFVREGDLCNKTLLDKSITRINELGIVEDFREADITVNTNVKRQQVELVFKLEPKKPLPANFKHKD
jgi:outer membrane protein insertion porin family